MPMEKTTVSNGDASTFEYAQRKQPKPFNFWRGLYNKDKGYILGRPLKNWGKFNLCHSKSVFDQLMKQMTKVLW